jgi:hypothetical protein
MVMDRLGSSTRMAGSGLGSSASARVSPMVTSGKPATATISPGPASSTSMRSRAREAYSSVTLPFSTDPSTRHQATVSPRRSVPLMDTADGQTGPHRARRRGWSPGPVGGESGS